MACLTFATLTKAAVVAAPAFHGALEGITQASAGYSPYLLMAGEIDAGLSTLGTVYSQLMTWMATIVTTISSTPLLLLPVGIFVAGAMIGLAKRFIGR